MDSHQGPDTSSTEVSVTNSHSFSLPLMDKIMGFPIAQLSSNKRFRWNETHDRFFDHYILTDQKLRTLVSTTNKTITFSQLGAISLDPLYTDLGWSQWNSDAAITGMGESIKSLLDVKLQRHLVARLNCLRGPKSLRFQTGFPDLRRASLDNADDQLSKDLGGGDLVQDSGKHQDGNKNSVEGDDGRRQSWGHVEKLVQQYQAEEQPVSVSPVPPVIVQPIKTPGAGLKEPSHSSSPKSDGLTVPIVNRVHSLLTPLAAQERSTMFQLTQDSPEEKAPRGRRDSLLDLHNIKPPRSSSFSPSQLPSSRRSASAYLRVSTLSQKDRSIVDRFTQDSPPQSADRADLNKMAPHFPITPAADPNPKTATLSQQQGKLDESPSGETIAAASQNKLYTTITTNTEAPSIGSQPALDTFPRHPETSIHLSSAQRTELRHALGQLSAMEAMHEVAVADQLRFLLNIVRR